MCFRGVVREVTGFVESLFIVGFDVEALVGWGVIWFLDYCVLRGLGGEIVGLSELGWVVLDIYGV